MKGYPSWAGGCNRQAADTLGIPKRMKSMPYVSYKGLELTFSFALR